MDRAAIAAKARAEAIAYAADPDGFVLGPVVERDSDLLDMSPRALDELLASVEVPAVDDPYVLIYYN